MQLSKKSYTLRIRRSQCSSVYLLPLPLWHHVLLQYPMHPTYFCRPSHASSFLHYQASWTPSAHPVLCSSSDPPQAFPTTSYCRRPTPRKPCRTWLSHLSRLWSGSLKELSDSTEQYPDNISSYHSPTYFSAQYPVGIHATDATQMLLITPFLLACEHE